jgi:pSer/pThr/pTyr-binding forkhead associated (FHA) protein
MSKLVLFLPDGTTQDLALNRERMTIGRRADNDICLSNLAVSGEHAVVVTILADSFLEDLGSTNGTLVNGRTIAKHFLRDRDHIDVGRHKLIYCTEDDAMIDSDVVTRAARLAARTLGEPAETAKPFMRPGRDVPPPAATEAAAATTPVPAPAAVPSPSTASIKVLTGINAGASMPLTKAETTIGRPGIQVAAIVQSGSAFLIKRIEGGGAPIVNGQAIGPEGTELAHGDQIDIAGTLLEFVAPEEPKPDVAAPDKGAEVEQNH